MGITHQGYLYCNSKLAKGTEFMISIPLYAFGHHETLPFPVCHFNQHCLDSALTVSSQPLVINYSKTQI
ncbi:hypothetical protein [Planktothrix mougeotii]|uniref:Uncharacterized protein n=1 Tax=Planktothrix mougeotii LEGE 06226 TaxID=1828728 RepID=A0ABR9U8E4_9CYAN|nr:hypothetical protein [Planktothrix mougeotii]MBE9142718.1 hypothetical protein [Planktothrix mougeotii LEGE 06226]